MEGGRVKLTEVNPHLVCVLCHGYFVDATTIAECLHSFCKSCIFRYLERESFCPICKGQVHKTKLYLSLKPDKTLQDIVYKLVPGLFHNEMQRRRDFYKDHPYRDEYLGPECRGVGLDRLIYSPEDKISLSLEFYDKEREREEWSNTGSPKPASQENNNGSKRYLQCPAGFKMAHLKKFLRQKYNLAPSCNIEIMYRRESLPDSYSLMDVAYIYTWKRNGPMRFYYRLPEVIQKRLEPLLAAQAEAIVPPPVANEATLGEREAVDKAEKDVHREEGVEKAKENSLNASNVVAKEDERKVEVPVGVVPSRPLTKQDEISVSALLSLGRTEHEFVKPAPPGEHRKSRPHNRPSVNKIATELAESRGLQLEKSQNQEKPEETKVKTPPWATPPRPPVTYTFTFQNPSAQILSQPNHTSTHTSSCQTPLLPTVPRNTHPQTKLQISYPQPSMHILNGNKHRPTQPNIPQNTFYYSRSPAHPSQAARQPPPNAHNQPRLSSNTLPPNRSPHPSHMFPPQYQRTISPKLQSTRANSPNSPNLSPRPPTPSGQVVSSQIVPRPPLVPQVSSQQISQHLPPSRSPGVPVSSPNPNNISAPPQSQTPPNSSPSRNNHQNGMNMPVSRSPSGSPKPHSPQTVQTSVVNETPEAPKRQTATPPKSPATPKTILDTPSKDLISQLKNGTEGRGTPSPVATNVESPRPPSRASSPKIATSPKPQLVGNKSPVGGPPRSPSGPTPQNKGYSFGSPYSIMKPHLTQNKADNRVMHMNGQGTTLQEKISPIIATKDERKSEIVLNTSNGSLTITAQTDTKPEDGSQGSKNGPDRITQKNVSGSKINGYSLTITPEVGPKTPPRENGITIPQSNINNRLPTFQKNNGAKDRKGVGQINGKVHGPTLDQRIQQLYNSQSGFKATTNVPVAKEAISQAQQAKQESRLASWLNNRFPPVPSPKSLTVAEKVQKSTKYLNNKPPAERAVSPKQPETSPEQKTETPPPPVASPGAPKTEENPKPESEKTKPAKEKKETVPQKNLGVDEQVSMLKRKLEELKKSPMCEITQENPNPDEAKKRRDVTPDVSIELLKASDMKKEFTIQNKDQMCGSSVKVQNNKKRPIPGLKSIQEMSGKKKTEEGPQAKKLKMTTVRKEVPVGGKMGGLQGQTAALDLSRQPQQQVPNRSLIDEYAAYQWLLHSRPNFPPQFLPSAK